MSGDIFYLHEWMEVLVASHGHRSRMSLNIQQCAGQPLTAENYQTPSVNTTEVERPRSTEKIYIVTWLYYVNLRELCLATLGGKFASQS